MDIISTIKYFFYEFITFKYSLSYIWIINVRYILMSHISFGQMYSSLLLNDYCIFRLCLTFWTNEFLGCYSNYKFIISFSIFNRINLWRTLYLQSYFEEVFSFSFSIPISSLWFYNPSSFLSSFPFF